MSTIVSTAGVMVDLIGKDEYRLGVWKRGQSMLVLALKEAGIKEGVFRFQPDGMSEDLMRHTLPVLEVQPTSFATQIFIRLKSGGKSDSTMKGMLRLLPGTDRGKLLRDLAPVLEKHNNLGWRDAFTELEPGEAPERWTAVTGKPHVPPAGNPALNGIPAPPPVTPVRAPTPAPVPAAKVTPSAPPKAVEAVSPQEKYLLEVLKGNRTGVFEGKGHSEIARKFFPGKPIGYYRTGLIYELAGSKLIERLGGGAYRVSQAFLDKHPELGIVLDMTKPLAVRRQQRPTGGPESPLTSGVRQAKAAAVPADISQLLAQRREINRQVSAARDQLASKLSEAEVALADAKLKGAEIARLITQATEAVDQRRSELEDFDRQATEG